MIKKFVLSAILIQAVFGFVFANILYVDNTISDGFWQGSYSTLQDALSAAQPGDEIWVAAGTYTPGTKRSDSFVLVPGVKLYGGFYGGESDLGDRELYTNLPVLSGDIGNAGDPSDNVYHVITYSGTLDATTVIDGFVIRDGYADDGNGGGGVLLSGGASPLFKHCRFEGNTSLNGGGAVNLKNGVTFEYCLFNSNTAVQGGGVYSGEDRKEDGNPFFDHCTFVNNIAGTGSALFFDKRESASVDSSIFWNNTDGSGNLTTFYLDSRASGSDVENTATDDAAINAVTETNIITYTSTDPDGPFKETDTYLIDNHHNIPQEWGWYFVPAPLVLNIKVFLEGAF